jgi:hypothetical protein
MSFRFFKRIDLIGGLGLNVSKSGPSLSLRTPYGTVGQKGVSIRTGIPGLTLRVCNLRDRLALSERKQAILLISEELDKVSEIGEVYGNNHAHFKRWNGIDLKYPSENYDLAFKELSSLIEQGQEIQQYLQALISLSSEHRTGLTAQLRKSLSELNTLQAELEALLKRFIAFKEAEERKGADRTTMPPLISAESHDAVDKVNTIRFACQQCQQHLEVNSSASGQSFKCPSCGCELTVPPG